MAKAVAELKLDSVGPVVTTEELRKGLVQLVDKGGNIMPTDKSGNPVILKGKEVKAVEIIFDPPEIK